jgi:hypothetical protein
MIVNNQVSHEAEYIGDIQENRVGIDKANIDFITTLLTSNLYSKPFESFLRETIANAYDSHLEAGTDKNIILLFEGKNEYSYTVSIRDYGTGVSPERFEKIYRNIGSSTKRESNDFIGMFGIGRFSALSCADTANITSYYNGKKYSYIMYKNGNSLNIDKLSEVEGDYPNGLEVSIQVKKDSYYDWDTAIYQLCLFDKLYVACKGECCCELRNAAENFNNRKVKDYNNTFSKCNILSRYKLYYRVGNILYEADGEHTYINTKGLIINIPIGTVDITPSRENLQYTEFTNKTLKEKSNEVKAILQDMATKAFDKDMTLEYFFTNVVLGDSFSIPTDVTNKEYLEIDKKDIELVIPNATINGKKIPDEYDRFLEEIKYITADKNLVHKNVNYRRGKYYGENLREFMRGDFILVDKLDKVTKAVTMDYFKDTTDNKPKVILIYEGIALLKQKIFDHLKVGRNLLYKPETIAEYIDFLFDNLTIETISNDDVPQSYIKEYREGRRTVKNTNTEVQVRLYRSNSYTYYKLKHLLNMNDKGFILYTIHTREDKMLRDLAYILYDYTPLKGVISMKAEDVSIIEHNKRFVNLDTFLLNKNRLLTKIMTAKAILKEFEKLLLDTSINYYSLPVYRKFSEDFGMNITFANRISGSSSMRELYSHYETNKWINKALVDYYKVSEEDVNAYKEYQRMNERKTPIIQYLAYKKIGRHPKVGIRRPLEFDLSLIKKV